MEEWIEKEYPRLEALYKELHSHPELSLKEEKTSLKIAGELKAAGLEVTPGIGGYGVVALLRNNGPTARHRETKRPTAARPTGGAGPTVLVRADMDALPIQEETGLPHASREAGVMHACGHDVHMTCLVGTARVLKHIQKDWRGTVVFIAQPAEEKGQGAEAMLKDGLLTRFPKPEFALALHVDSQLATGKIGYGSGYAFANVDSVDLLIHGRGAHGAYPHLGVDPILIASEIVLSLQAIVSRELKPYEPAVVTVGSIHGGTKHNIIPDQVKLELTVRSYADEVRTQILEAIKRITVQTARAHKAPKDPEIKVTESIPSTYNDPGLVRRLVPVLKKTFGEAHVVEKDPEMGGEDFGLYSRAGTPSFMFRVGSVSPERIAESRNPNSRPLCSLHSSVYAPEPGPTITAGIRAMTALVLELLGRP